MTGDSNFRLGRGLDSMVNEVSGIKAGSTSATGGGFMRIPLTEIKSGGTGRNSDELLRDSVKKFGVLQPVLVARTDAGYELLAGARRVHAAKQAGLTDVPAMIIPPDRAGKLDVMIEENLNRADLAASDRTFLRDRWMKETGRDEDQALARIPDQDIWQETEKPPGKKTISVWMVAAGVMTVVTSALLVLIFTSKPIDKRTVVIPVEFVETLPLPEPAAPVDLPENDRSWMALFLFPGHQVVIDGNVLNITPSRVMAQNNELTPAGKVFLNQLAAITQSTGQPLVIEILAGGGELYDALSDAAGAAAHLIAEGIPAGMVSIAASAQASSAASLTFRISL